MAIAHHSSDCITNSLAFQSLHHLIHWRQNTEFANYQRVFRSLQPGCRNGVDVYAATKRKFQKGVNFFFGTNNLGRDLFSCAYGTPASRSLIILWQLFDITVV